MSYTVREVLEFVKQNDVKFIRLAFCDMFGTQKNISIMPDELERAFKEGVSFDASAIRGFGDVAKSDLLLFPDADTLNVLPWRPQQGRVVRFFCDIKTPDKEEFLYDSRNILKKVVRICQEKGYTPYIGTECEFYLFKTDEDGEATYITHDKGGYFDIAPIDKGENIRREICLCLEEMYIKPETSHHEQGPGQNEIDFKYADALVTADNIATFKYVVKSIAQRHGLYATFMPKPLHGVNGSGMHINISLIKDGKNAFHNEEDELGLSSVAYNFIGGVLKHIKEICPITNPLVNSYKRLVPDYEAPVYIAGSAKNRSPLIRVPSAREEGTRIELRSPDPSSNPYLVLACLLLAGLEGIKYNLEPPKCIDKNIFDLNREERKRENIESLPESLHEAVAYMQKSDLVKEALGKNTFEYYIRAKEVEWDNYRTQVHQWEITSYLSKY